MKKDSKTIIATVYLFTNNLSKRNDGKIPIREEGTVYLRKNKSKGINNAQEVHFKKLDDIPNILRKITDNANLIIVKK